MILLLLSALILSSALTGLATIHALRRGMLDQPGERSSHTEPTPVGGGAGWVATFLLLIAGTGIFAANILSSLTIVLAFGMAALAVVGWRDDHHELSAVVRALLQTAVSAATFATLWLTQDAAGWLWAVPTVLFIGWMVNLYNFMDGSNGMAGMQGVFACLVLAGLYGGADRIEGLWLSLLLAACLAGFLPWNLGRARVFMGDTGSLALGYGIAVLLVHGVSSDAFSLPVALMVSALFLADASLTLAARVMRGERWYNAHRQHLYQRLIAMGWSHGRVLVAYQAVNVLLVLPAIVFGVSQPEWAWLSATALGLVLVTGWYLSIKTVGKLAEAKTIR